LPEGRGAEGVARERQSRIILISMLGVKPLEGKGKLDLWKVFQGRELKGRRGTN